MTMRAKMMGVIVAAGTLGMAASGRAGDASLDLSCWTVPSSGTFTWATVPHAAETTATTKTQSVGASFGYTSGTGDVLECSFHVPRDYDEAAATAPQVLLSGWTTVNDSCSGTEYVRFAVTARNFGGGNALTAAWPTEAIINFSFACITNGCSVGFNCNLKDQLHHVNVAATAAASDWVQDDLVFIKIRRDTADSGDTVDQAFHLSKATLAYSTP